MTGRIPGGRPGRRGTAWWTPLAIGLLLAAGLWLWHQWGPLVWLDGSTTFCF